jgi:hypothetical protein
VERGQKLRVRLSRSQPAKIMKHFSFYDTTIGEQVLRLTGFSSTIQN